MKMTILVDLDHTIRNSSWRDDLAGGKNWDEYHEAGDRDEPYDHMVRFLNSLHDCGYQIVMVTGISEKWRQHTTEYLVRHRIMIDEILMRANNDFRKTDIMKYSLVEQRFPNPAQDILLFIEDRDDVVTMFKSKGITCLQAHHP